MSFKELGLSEHVLKAIDECGYTEPTPIQAQAIPHVLMMRDLVGLAQTGTGKTAGFTLPMIEILAGGRAKARMPRSLILEPTRELAAQVAENFDTYGKYCNLSKALLVGGTSMGDQIKILDRGADVLIATPGRLLDLFERGRILLTDIKILVIDEADRMLDMGFIPDIEKIVSFLPPMRQTLLFSATMPPEIKRLTTQFLNNPREVSVAPPASAAETVKQHLVWTEPKKKYDVLDDILKTENVQNAFIFCNRKKDIGGLASWLSKRGYNAKPLHGDMAQSDRTRTLQEFKDDKITLLVCSDVAARGIDIKGMSHVFNFDVPMNPDDYVHRIGRTGRAGEDGCAWTLAVKFEEKYIEGIEQRIKTKIPVESGFGKKSTQGDSRGSSRSNARSNTKEKPRRDAPRDAPKGDSKTDRNSAPKHKNQESKPHKTSEQNQRPKQQQNDSVTGFGNEMPSFFDKD